MAKEIAEDNTYEKNYKMRALGEDGLNIVVSIPRLVISRYARQVGLSIDDFIATHYAVAQFNGFEGIQYVFRKKEECE